MKNKLMQFLLVFLISNIFQSSYGQKSEEWYLYTPDKLNIYIHEFGKGDTVIVLHGGFGAEHSYLIDALKPLENKFHFILFDQRGSLRSPAPDSLLSFEKMLADIETIRKSLHLERLTLLGHSMGTRLAMAYAEKHPMNVRNLVLLSSEHPVSSNSELRSYASYYLQNRDAVAHEIVKVRFPHDKKQWTAKMRTYSWRISFASVNIFNLSKRRNIKGGVAFFNQKTTDVIYPTAPAKWDFTATFKNCKFPLTVINGEYDYFDNFTAMSFKDLLSFYAAKKMTTVETILNEKNQTLEEFTKHKHWGEFKNEFPTLKVAVIKNAGHRIWMDNSKLFKRELNKSLNRKSGK
jgi:proline iminopeptidase